ncbi:MAG: putative quinol monooxygenase [Kiritimatiellia bacterium]|nr:putative quinol monooxygenase [Kiritimatiellia bacterium]
MIHVIATLQLKSGVRAEFLRIFKSNVPNVLAETGCRGYVPAVDTDSGLAAQAPQRPDTVVVVEAWDDLDCLRAHLAAPHMADYRIRVKDLVDRVSLQVLQSA